MERKQNAQVDNETIISRVRLPQYESQRRKRVAAYCRVSCGKDDMLHSLSAQVSYFNQYIQKRPCWEYAGVYVDEAITGTKQERPRFQQMLEDCRAGKIDMIMTKSISRFARNTLTVLQTVRELKAIGVDVFFEEQNIHSISGEGELMLTLLASFAQEESKSVSDNCKWRIRKDFAEGKPMNLMFIYGYKLENGRIIIDEAEAAVVRRIFDLYTGGMGSVQIAHELARENIPKRYDGEWTGNYVVDVLRNEKYTGDSLLQKTFTMDHLTKKKLHNKGEINQYYAENTHPAIIDRETYERAQKILSERRAYMNVQKSTVAHYPFTSKIICGKCGANYIRRTRSAGRDSIPRYTWQCLTYCSKGKRFCSAGQIPEETLITLTCEVLGIGEVTEKNIERLESIRVVAHNRLQFLFRDGHTEERQWVWKSRADVWTPEMRQKASAQMKLENMKRRQRHEQGGGYKQDDK